MTYNPEEFKTVQAGDRIDGEVTEIQDGMLSDFLTPEQLKKWQHSDPRDPSIQVTVTFGNGYVRKKLMSLPQGNLVSPGSSIGKWNKKYGAYPYVGQKVYAIADAEGFYDL